MMKVSSGIALILFGILSGCSGEDGKGKSSAEIDSQQTLTTESVLATFKKAGIPISKEEVYTGETDTNHLLGRPHQYIAKANWADGRLEQSEDGLTGGTVEIFDNAEDLQTRQKYVDDIGKAMPMLVQYQFTKGTALIRLDKALSPSQAGEYEKALNAISK